MTAATTAPTPAETRRRAGTPAGFRADIQGLRAVAVILVLLYHAGVPWVPGGYVGVDVFFVISGFLITGLVVREVETTGRLSLSRFWARRVRRLLPATAVTFAAVALLTILVLPVTRWATVAGDLVASTLYVVNWRLADRSVDYLAQGQAASPLQHFWSLAVEEQFYVVWPLLVVAVLAWAVRRGDLRRRLGWSLAVVCVASLAWSAWLTGADPGPAYFVTTTRLWELGIGALLAIGVHRLGTVPRVVRVAAGWAGLALVAVAALSFGASTPFPGVAALLPTLGTAAVIWAGSGDGTGRLRLLEPRPMQFFGAISYSLYLWHWPLLVAGAVLWGDRDGQLDLTVGLAVAAAAVVPAWLAYRLVELPLHRSPALARPVHAALAGAVCVAVGLASALAVHVAFTQRATATLEQDGAGGVDGATDGAGDGRGAQALGPEPTVSAAGEVVDAVTTIDPAPALAADDNPDMYDEGCHQRQADADVLSCTYGDASSDVVVALVGDSHAAQWQPALRALAQEHGWRLDTYTKSACPLSAQSVWLDNEDAPYGSCDAWVDGVLETLSEDRPSLVVTSSFGSYRAAVDGAAVPVDASRPLLADGLAEAWEQVRDATGAEVLVLGDTPYVAVDVPECVAQHPGDLGECAPARSDAVAASALPQQEVAARSADVRLVDLTDWVCPQDRCAPVIGGVLVYRDTDHLTATYVETLAPRLAEELVPLLER